MSFKLLAVKFNEDFPYIKNLHKKVLYKFYNDFEFKGHTDDSSSFRDIEEIIETENSPKDLYDIEQANGHKINVSISAILGRNGAGKSSLLEITYLLLYCISVRKGYTFDRKYLNKQIDRNINNKFYENLLNKVELILRDAKIELYYKIDDNYFMLYNSGKSINLYLLKDKVWKITKYTPQGFFYTIAVNYSLYGLNSSNEYFWLDGLFHKNDGYKTPLVINPFRNKGVIDINIELHLAQTRVLSNVIDESFNTNQIIGDKEIRAITINIIPDKVGIVGVFSISNIYSLTYEKYKIDLIDFAELLINRFNKSNRRVVFNEIRENLKSEFISKDTNVNNTFNYLFVKEKEVSSVEIKKLLAKYIIAKIIKICSYDGYKKHIESLSEEKPIPLLKDTDNLANTIFRDNSHITLKLKQAINAFIYNYFSESIWTITRDPSNFDKQMFTTNIKFEDFKITVKKAFNDSVSKNKLISHFIPTGFYRPVILLGLDNDTSEFSHLSSGEQQLLHSVHSILYHLINVDTVENTESKYKYVNLVLDEIELYYHPDFQRGFISVLLDNIKKITFKNIRGINIIFSTHSPFILSDIPHSNVLKMKKGNPEKFDDSDKTFGSNIHEMLADSFFLRADLLGEYAKTRIQSSIVYLNYFELFKDKKEVAQNMVSTLNEKKQAIFLLNDRIKAMNMSTSYIDYKKNIKKEHDSKSIYQLINIIGEPIIKYKLTEMYELVFDTHQKVRAKKNIREIMSEYGLTLEDL